MGLPFSHGRRREPMASWRAAAREAGLTDVTEPLDQAQSSLRGCSDELSVRFVGYQRGKQEQGTRIEIACPTRADVPLSVRPEGRRTSIGKRFGGAREAEIGDATFDRERFIEAPLAFALAIFDRPTRRALSRLLDGRLMIGRSERQVHASFEDGVLCVELPDPLFGGEHDRLRGALPPLLDLARRLLPPADLGARLAQNVRTERKRGVRLQTVLTLAHEFRDCPGTHGALVAACFDASEEIRLEAALALGEEGHQTLLALVAREETEDACRARAVTALGEGLDDHLVVATLRQARAARRLLTACACVELLVRVARPSHLALLVDALADAASEVRLAAIRGLGSIGTSAEVAPLLAIASVPGPLRSAARQAVAEIQARLKGAAPGQLSLAAGGAGALSIAEGHSGDRRTG